MARIFGMLKHGEACILTSVVLALLSSSSVFNHLARAVCSLRVALADFSGPKVRICRELNPSASRSDAAATSIQGCGLDDCLRTMNMIGAMYA